MLDFMNEIVDALLEGVVGLLPTSPFTSFIEALGSVPYISYINWFIPVGTFVEIGLAWLTSVATFYILMVLLRWIRAIE